jgi:hypothetical protein
MSRARRAIARAAFAAITAVASAHGAPRGDSDKTPLWQLIEKIAAARGFSKELDAAVAHQGKFVSAEEGAVHPFARVKESLTQPWSVPLVARELRDALAAPVRPDSKADAKADAAVDLVPLVDAAARFFDLDPEKLTDGNEALDRLWREIADPATVETELLERLSEYLGACHDLAAAAADQLDDDDRALLRSQFPDFCEVWFRGHFKDATIEQRRAQTFEKYKHLSKRMNRAKLLIAARAVAHLADPPFVASLSKRLAKTPRTSEKVDGISGDLIAIAGHEPKSRVVLLGSGKSKVTLPFALAIDLGGDDTWTQAALADDATRLASVVLELDGNDAYESDGRGPAYAATGCALLVDAKGNDKYVGKRLGQGASSVGFAALLDRGGNDQYSAEDFVQGYSFGGVGLLLDREGKDSYSAWAYAQGAGMGPCFAALADGKGDDHYVANGHWPDVYGDSGEGSFHGASQGYCTGFREGELLPGGFATLVDLDGKDDYESGNFSQGGAYFYGFGLMYDGGGDDVNHGWRYSQGFGVHQAAGMRWDAGGNDLYVTKCAANCGSAWDEGVGFLVDDGGDDQYDVGGLALGGAAETAFAVLLDGGGNDRYGGGGGNDSQGGSGAGDYHEKEGVPQSFGVLVDLGGGKDSFTRKGRDEETIATGDKYGLFVHAKSKSVEALLDPATLKKALDAKPTPPKPDGKPDPKSGQPAKPKH